MGAEGQCPHGVVSELRGARSGCWGWALRKEVWGGTHHKRRGHQTQKRHVPQAPARQGRGREARASARVCVCAEAETGRESAGSGARTGAQPCPKIVVLDGLEVVVAAAGAHGHGFALHCARDGHVHHTGGGTSAEYVVRVLRVRERAGSIYSVDSAGRQFTVFYTPSQRVTLKPFTWRSSSFAFASCSKCRLTGSRMVFSAAARLAFRSPGWTLSAK